MTDRAKRSRGAASADGVSSRDVAKISAQLEQVRNLLSEAVGQLTSSFETLRSQSNAQRSLMDGLVEAMATAAEAGGESGYLSVRELAREIGTVHEHFTRVLVGVRRESEQTVSRIDTMAAQLDAVFKRLEQIDEISEATYLLSINASIHAANARGQEGTGLAVIASNVRELSRQTRSFNGEIGDQLERARGTITDARRSMSELARASQELDVVLESERRVRGMIEGALAFEAFTQRTIERANGAAVLIARAASDAVTALQFEDIVEQILAVVGRRVRALGGGDEATDAPTRDPAPQVSIVPGDVEIF